MFDPHLYIMENICVIADFNEIVSVRKFEKIDAPEPFDQYNIYAGGNFFFVSNHNKMTIRFHQPNFERRIPQGAIEGWIRKIKVFYPNF